MPNSNLIDAIDWQAIIKDGFLVAAGTGAKMLYDYFTTKKQIAAQLNQTDAGTNQILNNMIQVSTEQLQDWMKSALESAKKIVELQNQLGQAEIKNGKLAAQIEELKDFLNKTLVMVKENNSTAFAEFEKEIHEILGA